LQAQLKSRIGLCQQQEIIDQSAHARRLVADSGQGFAAHGRIIRCAAAQQIYIALDSGQGCSQLVADIGHEALLGFE